MTKFRKTRYGRHGKEAKKTDKTENKSGEYKYYIGSAKGASDYDKTTEYLKNYFLTNLEQGDKIARLITTGVEYNFDKDIPTLQEEKYVVGETDEEKQSRLHRNKAHLNDYQSKKDRLYDTQIAYKQAKIMAAGEIFGRCTQAMQNKIKGSKGYNPEVWDDPVKLLKLIKEYSMSYDDNQQRMAAAYEAHTNFFKIRQKNGEPLIDYIARFKTARDVLTSQVDLETSFRPQAMEHPSWSDTNEEKQKEALKKAADQFMAISLLSQADQSKYGSIIANLKQQQQLGNDQYPKDLQSAHNLLGNHKFDQGWNDSKPKGQRGFNKKQTNDREFAEAPQLGFAQIERKVNTCFKCGKKGHISPNCKNKSIPYGDKTQWAFYKDEQNKQYMQAAKPAATGGQSVAAGDSGQASTAPSSIPSHVDQQWYTTQTQMCMQFFQPRNLNMHEAVLLDSQSSVDLFCNPRMVTNIRKSSHPMKLSTNAGVCTVDMVADIPNYGTVWFSPKAMTNIFSMGNVRKKHKVTIDTEEENAMIVHGRDGKPIAKYIGTEDNLYVWRPFKDKETAANPGQEPRSDTKPTISQFVETVKENKSFHTPRDIAKAKRARNLLYALGCPTIRDLKNIIKMNSIMNNPVTVQDVDLAVQIFGLDVPSAKGKITRRRPNLPTEDIVAVPPELLAAHQHVELAIDTMFVCGIAFLTTISKKIKYRTATWIPKLTKQHYMDALEPILRMYARAGMTISRIHADNEFRPALNELKYRHQFEPVFVSAQEHVPEAERNNRTLKERIRAAYALSPLKTPPKAVIQYMVTEAAKKLNYFPPQGGISDYFSPREILHHRKLDYRKQCIPTLSCVIGHEVSTNTPRPRGWDCIYLCQNDPIRGGHTLYHVVTQSVITRPHVTVVPYTDDTIKAINQIGRSQGINNLKITTRGGRILHDHSLLAGVEHEEHETEEDNDSDYETDTEASEDTEEDDLSDFEDEELHDPNDVYDTVKSSSQPDRPEEQEQGTVQAEPTEDLTNPTEEADGTTEEAEPQAQPRRSTRVSSAPSHYVPSLQGKAYEVAHLQTQETHEMEYTTTESRVIATIIDQFNDRMGETKIKYGNQHVVTYSLKKGINKFGQRGQDSASKEMKQIHDRKGFQPIHKTTMSRVERQRAMESLIFLTEKRDGTIKARHCANGSTQRSYMEREEVTSPTVSTESIMLTAVIDAKEGRDVATCDIPNAFIQTEVQERDKDGNRMIMKIRGACVEILCQIDPTYKEYCTIEKGNKVLYVHLTKAIYGLMVSAMLFYRKLTAALIACGFEINPYDPCVANKIVEGSQITVTWHVDDVKVSHGDPRVVDSFLKWIKDQFGAIGEVKVTRGKIHDYLGMILDYSIPGQVSIDMTRYVKSMVDNMPKEALQGRTVPSPWTENLFRVREDSPKLPQDQAELFHKVTAQGLFLCKRARPDIAPAIAYLSTRVRQPNQDDWSKLCRMSKYLQQTVNDKLTLQADDLNKMRWYVDASFATHPDFKSHTGATMTMGKGAITSISRKQGMNTRSSTEAEVVAADEVVGAMLWTKLFLEHQGYHVKENILYQDNRSAMLLESNGRKSAGKRSRHLNIRYFFVADQKRKGNITIEYCPTDQMLGDYMTKPLHGPKFSEFRKDIMNLPHQSQLFIAACSYHPP